MEQSRIFTNRDGALDFFMRPEDFADVKKSVGTESLIALTDLFRKSQGTPPGIKADRYRADHVQWLDLLDRLESSQLFLKRSNDGTSYNVRVHALPLIEDDEAKKLLVKMNQIYRELQTIYDERLTAQVPIAAFLDANSQENDLIKRAFYYMADTHSVWCGLSNGFPFSDDAFICISESVLKYENFDGIMEQFFKWHFLNAKKGVMRLDPHVINAGNQPQSPLVTPEPSAPEWYQELDDTKKLLLSELDAALAIGLTGLPTMGLRTLVESVMLDHIKDLGSFQKNLESFRDAGFVTGRLASMIEDVVNAGHAAIHRAYFPNDSDVRACFRAIKHLIEGVYILKPRIDRVSENTPKRK